MVAHTLRFNEVVQTFDSHAAADDEAGRLYRDRAFRARGRCAFTVEEYDDAA